VSSWRIAWRMVQARSTQQLLTAAVVALGLGLMLTAVAVSQAAQGAVSLLAARYPLVVGPDHGAVSLVLGSLTRLQDLEAGVDAGLARQLRADPRVELAVPLLSGHAVEGYQLLGTSPDWLSPRERFPLQAGRIFENASEELVAGSSAAAALGLELGQLVSIQHQHAGAPGGSEELRLVGLLQPTGTDVDGSLFCPIQAIFDSHAAQRDGQGHTHEATGERISAILLRPVDDAALLDLQEELEARPGLQVALTGQTLRRLSDQLAGGGRLLRMLVSGVVLLSFLSLLMSLYLNGLSLGREVAIMRVLGARRWQVVGIVGLASLLVIAAGVLGALGLGALLCEVAERSLRMELGLDATVALSTGSALVYLGLGCLVLLVAGIQPALAAYHVQAAEAVAAPAGSGLATRSYLRWSLRFLVPLAIFIWAEQMMAGHDSEGVSRPLDPTSTAVFQQAASWTSQAVPPALAAVDGQALRLQGYMYALGDPWQVQDFYLVALNPRTPRCPFCYRSPSRHERILVTSQGRSLEVAPGLVTVSGRLHLRAGERDQLELALDTFQVVLDR